MQLPPHFGPAQIDQLRAWLDFWPQDLKLAVEMSHPDFYQEPQDNTQDELLRSHHAARVIMDTRPIRTGMPKEQKELQASERKPHLSVYITTTSDFAFVRYIGHPNMEVKRPCSTTGQVGSSSGTNQQGLTVYAFCHCPYEVPSP